MLIANKKPHLKSLMRPRMGRCFDGSQANSNRYTIRVHPRLLFLPKHLTRHKRHAQRGGEIALYRPFKSR